MTADTEGDAARKRLLLLMTPSTYRASAFLDAARRLGVETIRGLDAPRALTEHWELPITLDSANVAASVESIVAFHRAHPLDAIVAVDDGATQLAALANTALHIAQNPPEAAEAARDKGIMRVLMQSVGVPCPVFRRFALAADPHQVALQVTYPCVVKPLRLSGSRGVMRADTPEQFVQAFERLKRLLVADGNDSARTDILVEDFIPGVEVALEGLLTDGELRMLALFDKPDPLDGPFFEETIYVTPSRLPQATQQAIAACAGAAARSIGLREGPVHAELRVNERGPWMLEIAGRSIGGLCSTVLEFGTGITLEEIILRHALALPLPDLDLAAHAAGVMMIPIPKGGMLHAVGGVEAARSVPHVTGVEITVRPHTAIVPLPEGASYLGFIFARAADSQTVEAALRAAHHELTFDIRPLLPVLH